jgi:hypothetical protein
VQAHRMRITVPEEHHLEIRLPQDFPAGPAEIIVLAGPSWATEAEEEPSGQVLAALENLRSLKLTEDEERVLADFEGFRQANPFDLSSLHDEER